MSRFFKSAAFPILIVVVLAFFAQQLISPEQRRSKPTFGTSTRSSARRAQSSRCTRGNELEVTLKDKSKYKVGFASDYAGTLTNRLISAENADKIAASTSRARRPAAGCRC